MSNPPITSNPRFLLFPQVDRPEASGERPVVRRYSLTLLPTRREVRAPRSASSPRGLTTA